ncbi:phospholipase A-2-activating protein [Aplysia californica]|uniref:Phospholipase A-2-activating protein n=1 Tax=Aplysia californica TaxID=6500 RepID=A0ABM0JYK8_APLCA|nr:phospholipase A-2-activating protein [Aplysia californica]
MATPYKLRCNLTGHEKDVRALVSSLFPEHGLISGSRDNTSCIWAENEGSNSFVKELTMRGHSNFVSSLCVMPPDDSYPQGLIITGSNDKTILAYSPGVPEPVFKLTGHTGNVCALASGKFGFLLSGSWDMTARVWLNQKCVMVLEGHQMAVWAVGIISGQGVMLTGSADKSIKAWKAGKCIQTYKGHEDCVRGLGVVSEAEFLSCSNDATIRRWAVTSGDCLAVYYGHTNYVYSLSILPNGQDFVTGAEDRTLRVWKDGKLSQTIYHPSESVWAVCALPNGDIASGASDGIIRVFTQDPKKYASDEVIAAHEASLASAPVASQPLGDIKVEDLPGPESLDQPGKKDGQTTMINTGGTVDVYQWDASQTKWVKIGNVVGSSGSTQSTSGKTLYEGKEYDYVFSVDIKEGAPPLKLPYNIAEDPWMAAQKFLHKHELSQLFLDQVANFILENTKGVTLGTGSASGYSDPFTGGDRYVPGRDDMDTSGATPAGSDPFTGGGRYVPGEESTGSGNTHFPIKTCLFFDTASPIEQILGKLKEFNKSVDDNLHVPEESLDELGSLLTGHPRGDSIKTLDQLITWPHEVVFPALDILRMAIKEHEVCRLFCSRPSVIDLMCQHASQGNNNACRMLSLRTLTNLFRHPEGTELNISRIDSVLQVAINGRDMTTKKGQIAVATLILNFCVKLAASDDLENKSKCLQAAGEVLGSNFDPEAVYRLLVGVGTLVGQDDGCKALAQSIDLPELIAKLNTSESGKLTECSKLVSSSFNS